MNDLPTAAVEKLTAQLGEALFGQPGMDLIEITNRCAAARGQRPLLCATCYGIGMIGGPSFQAPDEGGEPCPDCSQPSQPGHADERAQFEAWAEENNYNLRKWSGDYVALATDHAWLGYQAALAARQPDTTLASIYELLGVRNESDAGAEIARLHIAAHQPVGQEPVDIEAALSAGDANWQAHCRPNLSGSERLFFAVRDIAEMRAMLAGEKKPLPGSGLAVVRVNPHAPSVVPYQCAHRLLGDAYQAGTQGTGFCDQAEELFVAMTSQGKRDRMSVVYSAPPAQAVDLGQFREAVKHWRRDLVSDYAGGHINDGGTAMAEADRLLALIDSQTVKS